MSNGYLSDGSGPEGAAYGRCTESGRAYKRDGTVRKARTIKTPEQQLADLYVAEQRAQAGMGRKVLASMAGFATFLSAFGTFKAWVKMAKRFSTDDGIASERAKLEQRLADLDTKQELSGDWLEAQGDAIEQANGVFAKVGAAYIAFSRENGKPPNAEQGATLVANVVDAEAIAAVEASTDPANAPFASLNADESPEGDDHADDDTL